MTKDGDQHSFERQLEKLNKRFESAKAIGESDNVLGQAILEYILKRVRLQRGVKDMTDAGIAVDKETLIKLESWDSADPTMSTVEKVFKRLSGGRFADAAALLKESIKAKQQHISEQQRARASTPREKHPVKLLMEEIVDQNPSITEPELRVILKGHIGHGVIQDIDEDAIDPVDDCFPSLKMSGLKDQLSRIKKANSR
jgi:hypothetical protein